MGIPLEFGRDSIRGGASVARTFLSGLDMASAHFLDLAGAGADGVLTGAAGACCLVADHMGSRVTHFMTATPTSMGITVVTPRLMREAAAPRVVTPHQRPEEIRGVHAPAPLAESPAVEMHEVILPAECPACAAAVAAVAMPVAVAMAAATGAN